MNDLSVLKLLIEYGPYVGIYFFVEALKQAFKIQGRWVWLGAFILGWIMAAAQIVVQEVKLAPAVFGAKVFLNGIILGGISIAVRKILTEVFIKNTKGAK